MAKLTIGGEYSDPLISGPASNEILRITTTELDALDIDKIFEVPLTRGYKPQRLEGR